MAEFLPFCDLLFNIISLAGYFCNVVFNALLGYALLERGKMLLFVTVTFLVTSTLFISQIVSLRWYYRQQKTKITSENSSNNNSSNLPYSGWKVEYTVIIIHILQLGVLWRYAKLLVPIDIRRVKKEVRDLCMLRIIHAFMEAAPMLLISSYILITFPNENRYANLKNFINRNNFGSKNSSPVNSNDDKPFKSLNTVSVTLSLFSICWSLASFNKNVRVQNVHRLVLTWLGVIFQFLWRLGTVVSRVTSLTVYASLYKYWIFLVIILHWISMFLWLISPKNIFHGEKISKSKKIVWSALISFVYIIAYINLNTESHRQKMTIFYTIMFLENILLMFLWVLGVWHNKPTFWYIIPLVVIGAFVVGIMFMGIYYRFFHIRRLNWIAENTLQVTNKPPNNEALTGVFNCRFTNPTSRKKKKPTSFIPPPSIIQQMTPMVIPFWRRSAQSVAGSSENEGSVKSSKVNIHLKLAEKKQKQLAELRIIEEEIRQGIIGCDKDNGSTLPMEPIPMSKILNLESLDWSINIANMDNEKCLNNFDELENLNKISEMQYKNIHHMQNGRQCIIHNDFHFNDSNYENACGLHFNEKNANWNFNRNQSAEFILMAHRLQHSERNKKKIQYVVPPTTSFTSTYTLARETSYQPNVQNKKFKVDPFLTQENSSDGDVDSVDDNESDQQANAIHRKIRKKDNRQKLGKSPQHHSNQSDMMYGHIETKL